MRLRSFSVSERTDTLGLRTWNQPLDQPEVAVTYRSSKSLSRS